MDCLSVVCQLSVSCLLVVCQLSASCCQRRAVGGGRATASSKRPAASSRRQAAGFLRPQAPGGQRRLTDAWRLATNAQISSLARALASILAPLVGRSGRLFCSLNNENRHGKPKQKIIFVVIWNLSEGEKLRRTSYTKKKTRKYTRPLALTRALRSRALAL